MTIIDRAAEKLFTDWEFTHVDKSFVTIRAKGLRVGDTVIGPLHANPDVLVPYRVIEKQHILAMAQRVDRIDA